MQVSFEDGLFFIDRVVIVLGEEWKFFARDGCAKLYLIRHYRAHCFLN